MMLGAGLFLVIFGLAATHVSGAMPGAKPLYPVSLRFRLIWISFGLLMLGLGLFRVIR